jgi:hypothetical protein
MKRYCTVCGKLEDKSDHHWPIWKTLPEDCVCDPGTWLGLGDVWPNIGPVCSEYQGNGREYCTRCSHDEKCHKKSD